MLLKIMLVQKGRGGFFMDLEDEESIEMTKGDV